MKDMHDVMMLINVCSDVIHVEIITFDVRCSVVAAAAAEEVIAILNCNLFSCRFCMGEYCRRVFVLLFA